MILVVGSTGDLGGRVVRLLHEQRRPVRALIRPGTDGAELHQRGVEVVSGELTDPDSLPAACRGIEVVISTATAMTTRRRPGAHRQSIDQVDRRGMAALVDAAEQAGVRRFVCVTSAGLDDALGTPYERAKIATEKRLRGSSMRTVIVRPDAFQETHLAPQGGFDMVRGKVIVFGKGDARTRWVSIEDVAALIVAVAVESDPPEIIEFGGPEALSRNEAINTAERLTGRRIERQHVPRWLLRLAMGLLARPYEALASALGLVLLRDLRDSYWDDSHLQQRGIAARPASAFLEEQARAIGTESYPERSS